VVEHTNGDHGLLEHSAIEDHQEHEFDDEDCDSVEDPDFHTMSHGASIDTAQLYKPTDTLVGVRRDFAPVPKGTIRKDFELRGVCGNQQ
jgi:hypothetical protein